MKVPCPVPLQSPWSPAGYQVVEVADEVTVIPASPPRSRSGGDTTVPESPRRPSSPVGYRVTQVGEEHVPGPSRPVQPAHRSRRLHGATAPRGRAWPEPPPRHGFPGYLWGIIGVSSFVIVLLLIASISQAVSHQPPPFAGPNVQVAEVPVNAVNIPQAPQVVLPEAGAVNKADGKPELLLPPLPEANDLPREIGQPAAEVCNPAKAADRETFGTAVPFARNPFEAARQATAERKLTFVLHVSGNFEEARFT
jgi:hypothetical protein